MRVFICNMARALMLVFLVGCVSSGNYGRAVSSDKNDDLVVYSSDDQRSSLRGDADRKKMAEIIDELRNEVKANPKNSKAILDLAHFYVLLGKFDVAEKLSRRVLIRDVKNVEAKKILAQIALRRGNFDLASIYLEGLGGARSRDAGILNMLALIDVRRGNNSRALSLFQEAVKVNSGDLAARMNLGVLYVKYRMFSQAALEFERILKIVPEHRDAKIHLAIVQIARGHDSDAEKLLRTVLNEQKDNPLALYNLALALKNQSRYDEALASIKSYLKTAKGRSEDNEQVFALVDDIKKSQVESGQTVTDEDMQELTIAASQKNPSKQARIGQSSNSGSGNEKSNRTDRPTEPQQTPDVEDPEHSDLEKDLRN